MKFKNIIFLTVVFIIISLSLASCLPLKLLYLSKLPDNFPGTTYSTEDGTIWFNVYEESTVFVDVNGSNIINDIHSNMIGQITKDGKIYDFFLEIAEAENGYMNFISTEISENYSDDLSYFENLSNNIIFSGAVSYKSKTHFILTVDDAWNKDKGGLYEYGTKLEFFRTETKQ